MEYLTRNTESPEEAQEKTLGRRKLLKALVASGGAIAAATLLPGKWVKPVVEVGVLPAHAQVSPNLVRGDLKASLDWGATNDNPYFELHVLDPADGLDLSRNTPGLRSETLTHSGDLPGKREETVENTTPGVVAAGTYQIYVQCTSRGGFIGWVKVKVEVNGTAPTFSLGTTFKVGEARRVADVTFPGGTVADRAGQPYP